MQDHSGELIRSFLLYTVLPVVVLFLGVVGLVTWLVVRRNRRPRD
jgi:heme/copper-type cytochrome/quinol oxidase subunit 2